jgi:Beta-propeller repeat
MNKKYSNKIKSVILIIFLLSFSLHVLAQVPTWEWAKKSNGDNFDDSYATATDQNGNFYVTGVFTSSTISFGNNTLTNQGFRDAFIVKYDSNGNVLWAKNIGGIDEQQIFGVCTDNANNVYITGDFGSPTLVIDNITLSNSIVVTPSTQDIFIAKLNSNGTAIWAKNAGGSRADYGNAVVADNNGNVYLGGQFVSPSITIGGFTLTNVETTNIDHDVFLAKYDSNGNVIWTKSAGGTNYETLNSLSLDNSGNLYSSGYFYSPTISFGSNVLVNTNNYGDIFILKYDADGNLLWTRKCGGTNYESVKDIATDSNGNLYVTGYFQSPTMTLGTTTLANSSNSNLFNIFLAKYNPSGTLLWANKAGGTTSNDYSSSVNIDSADNVYISGAMNSSSIAFGNLTPIVNSGNTDIFLAKYNASGVPIWSKKNRWT